MRLAVTVSGQQLTCAPLLLRDELTQVYAGVFRSSVLMLSNVSLRPLLTELLSSQLKQERGKGQRLRELMAGQQILFGPQ